MNAVDSKLFSEIKKALGGGYWTRFNTEAQHELARVALEAIQRKEQELLRIGAGR
jgi:hypothetical protein